MEPIALTVNFADGSKKTVTCIAADLIAFETKFDLSVVKLEQDLRLTHLFYLAWHATKRSGETSDDFEKWTESVAIVSQAQEKK